VLIVNVADADNLLDWLSASSEVYYDLDREVLLFGARSFRVVTLRATTAPPNWPLLLLFAASRQGRPFDGFYRAQAGQRAAL